MSSDVNKYYTPTRADHEAARQEYIDRVPMPSRCVHSVPVREACMSCEIDNELEREGFPPYPGERPAWMSALKED